MENQSEKLDHQVAGLPSLCLASSRIQFSVHTADEPALDLTVVGRRVRKPALECVPLVARQRVTDHSEPRIARRGCAIIPNISNRRPSWTEQIFARAAVTSARSINDLPPFLAKA